MWATLGSVVTAAGKAADTYRRAAVFRRVHQAQAVHRQVKRDARTLASPVTAPAASGGRFVRSMGATSSWFMGSNQRMPWPVRFLVVCMVLLFLVWSAGRHLADVKVVPVPFAPTWGYVYGMILPDLSDDAAVQDSAMSGLCAQITPTPYTQQPTPGGSAVQASAVTADPALFGSGDPWLTTVLSKATKGLVDDATSVESLRGFGTWTINLGRVIVSSLEEGITGTVSDTSWRGKYDARIQQTVAACTGGSQTFASAAPAGPVGLCPASGSSAERGLSPYATTVLRCGAATFPQLKSFGGVGARGNKSDHPSGHAVDLMIPAWQTPAGKALGSQVAAWYVAHAEQLHVKYVIWDARINTLDGRGWRPYVNPQCSSAARCGGTLQHLDHVHISVKSGPVT